MEFSHTQSELTLMSTVMNYDGCTVFCRSFIITTIRFHGCRTIYFAEQVTDALYFINIQLSESHNFYRMFCSSLSPEVFIRMLFFKLLTNPASIRLKACS